MSVQRIKKGDSVVVKVGRESGKAGKVSRVFPSLGTVLVDGVNVIKRARKRSGERPGEFESFEKPILISKVAVVCKKCNASVRVLLSGRNRLCRKCSESLD